MDAQSHAQGPVRRLLVALAATVVVTIACRPSTYASIFQPVKGARFTTADTIVVRGELNSNAGRLGPVAWSWASDRDGPLGDSVHVGVPLSVGRHRITLTVSTSGGTVSDAITVFVDY